MKIFDIISTLEGFFVSLTGANAAGRQVKGVVAFAEQTEVDAGEAQQVPKLEVNTPAIEIEQRSTIAWRLRSKTPDQVVSAVVTLSACMSVTMNPRVYQRYEEQIALNFFPESLAVGITLTPDAGQPYRERTA